MKKFNVTGVCIPERHYMVDTTKKIDEIILRYINDGEYFTINRPRQYGKTTTMYLLEQRLKEEYIFISLSFEGLGDKAFESEENFISNFINLLKREFKMKKRNKILEYIDEEKDAKNFGKLDEFITDLMLKIDKEVILMIDEVDKSSNNQIFLNFIGMLRDKYLRMSMGRDKTFHNVILAGVHDIKNMKLKLRLNEEKKYNSPWNIAVDFDIDMSFSVKEISGMLEEYSQEQKIQMDIEKISKLLRSFTSGYPFLVSKLCKIMDEKLDKEFTEESFRKAVNMILNEKNTLFDDVIKNIENNKNLKKTIEELLLDGRKISYNVDADELGFIYGILDRDERGLLKLDNKIFELRIYNYLLAKREREKGPALNYKYRTNFIDDSNILNMKTVLEKFQLFMKSEYRSKDEKFIEREGRLLFLSFLKPIINGEGFYFVEPETRQDNRMDIVVVYNKIKYIIELKIWYGEKRQEEARNQLNRYLESQGEDKGYLVSFNFNENKKYEIKQKVFNGKEIFEVTV